MKMVKIRILIVQSRYWQRLEGLIPKRRKSQYQQCFQAAKKIDPINNILTFYTISSFIYNDLFLDIRKAMTSLEPILHN